MQSYSSKTKQIPMRKCLVTGTTIEKKDLIRFVVDPENNLIADINQNLPGKGYWVKADRDTISKAINKKILCKAIKKKVTVEKNVLEKIEIQITKQIINQISLSRKAGAAIFGFDKIKASIKSNNIGLVIQALDGSDREKKRLRNHSIPKIIDDCLTGSELGKAFGREKVIHCAILRSDFVENIYFHSNRLNNLKNPVPHYDNI
jgi:predicted RNA-binding protein YlxR (DUF448 family)